MSQFSSSRRVMELETISKNGAISKSHTSRVNFLKMCFTLFAAGIIIVSINACSNVTGQTSNTKSERWEYKIMRSDPYNGNGQQETQDKLNGLGAEGWELVTTNGSSNMIYYTLKRRVK